MVVVSIHSEHGVGVEGKPSPGGGECEAEGSPTAVEHRGRLERGHELPERVGAQSRRYDGRERLGDRGP